MAVLAPGSQAGPVTVGTTGKVNRVLISYGVPALTAACQLRVVDCQNGQRLPLPPPKVKLYEEKNESTSSAERQDSIPSEDSKDRQQPDKQEADNQLLIEFTLF